MTRAETRFAWNGDVSLAYQVVDRTRSLIVVDPQVTYTPTAEMPWMPTVARWQELIARVRSTWGTLEWWDAPDVPDPEISSPRGESKCRHPG